MTSFQRRRISTGQESTKPGAVPDTKIEASLAEFFTAGDERDTLVAQLAAVENTIGRSVQSLFDLGENAGRVAALLDLDPKEVKRLRGLTTLRTTAEPVPSASSVTSTHKR